MSFSPNELVWYKQEGQTHSAGYSIDSMLARSNMKPLTTLNQPIQNGGSSSTGQFSDLFRFMGVPAGLSTMLGEDIHNTNVSVEEGGLVTDSLFDKLLSLASPSETHSSTNQSQSGGKKKNKRTKKASQNVNRRSSDKKTSRRTRRK